MEHLGSHYTVLLHVPRLRSGLIAGTEHPRRYVRDLRTGARLRWRLAQAFCRIVAVIQATTTSPVLDSEAKSGTTTPTSERDMRYRTMATSLAHLVGGRLCAPLAAYALVLLAGTCLIVVHLAASPTVHREAPLGQPPRPVRLAL